MIAAMQTSTNRQEPTALLNDEGIWELKAINTWNPTYRVEKTHPPDDIEVRVRPIHCCRSTRKFRSCK